MLDGLGDGHEEAFCVNDSAARWIGRDQSDVVLGGGPVQGGDVNLREYLGVSAVVAIGRREEAALDVLKEPEREIC